MTTNLGMLDLAGFLGSVSVDQAKKEKEHYFTLARLQKTPGHMLLPAMMVSNEKNEDTPAGDWNVASDGHKVKIWAFLLAMEEMQVMSERGHEEATSVFKKMVEAAGEIKVSVCKYEEEGEFQASYNEGEDADLDQAQKTNARTTNRGKLLARARVQVSKLKTEITSKDLVAFFIESEAKGKITTTIAKNKITNAEDVTRVEKVYAFLLEHHLEALFQKVEWTPEVGATPLFHWTTARFFMAVVDSDGPTAEYVLKALDNVLYDKEDPSSKLKKDKVLESGKKLHSIMKVLALQYKTLRDTEKMLSSKPIAAPGRMKADQEVMKNCLDFTLCRAIAEDTTGIVQSLTLPAQKFVELGVQICQQRLFGKFSEAEQNNPNFEKMKNCDTVLEFLAPVTTMWEEYHIQFMPQVIKDEWIDDEMQDVKSAAVGLTRAEAKKRAALAELHGYVKGYVMLNDEALDRNNLMEFQICKTTVADAPENMETKGHVRAHVYDEPGWGDVNAAYVANRNPYLARLGLNHERAQLAENFYTLLEDPSGKDKKREDNIGTFVTWDLGTKA